MKQPISSNVLTAPYLHQNTSDCWNSILLELVYKRTVKKALYWTLRPLSAETTIPLNEKQGSSITTVICIYYKVKKKKIKCYTPSFLQAEIFLLTKPEQ